MSQTPPIESFCCAYWDYLRNLRATEPCPSQYGLCECQAQALMRQCHYEFTQQVVQKAIQAAQGIVQKPLGAKIFSQRNHYPVRSRMRRGTA